MNKLKLLMASILCSSLMLTGCVFNNGTSHGSSSEPGTVEPSEPSEPGEPSEPEADPVLQGIAITGEYKTEYEVGEEFDATGIIVTASYDKGEPKDVTAETVFSGFDSSVAGPIVVTATYLEKTAEINLTILESVTGLSPEEAITEIAAYWSGSVQEVQSGVFGAYGAFPASSYSVDDMKNFVSSLFVPEEFELVNDWAVAEDGTNSCLYANAVLTVLEIYVYADTVYVKDGMIVEEGTEGAVATDITCIEVYGYTYSGE